MLSSATSQMITATASALDTRRTRPDHDDVLCGAERERGRESGIHDQQRLPAVEKRDAASPPLTQVHIEAAGLWNRDASSPNDNAPARMSAPHPSQRPNVNAGEATAPMSSAGVRKIPTATVLLMTSAVADPRPRPRAMPGWFIREPVSNSHV